MLHVNQNIFTFSELIPIKLVFLLGATNVEKIQFLLETEAEKNDDILQINVEDSYHTLVRFIYTFSSSLSFNSPILE